jgi:hypothetical protein
MLSGIFLEISSFRNRPSLQPYEYMMQDTNKDEKEKI